jgi:processive 1,2-diacylglycerol beta-glucosyltransferase
MSVETRILSSVSSSTRHATAAREPRVLLLTSELGYGHAQAARAVALAILERAPNASVRTLDLWSLMHASVADTVQQAYLRLVQEHPDLYERIYQLDERTWRRIFQGDEAAPPQLAEGLERITAIFADAPAPMPQLGPYALDCALLPLLCSSLPGGARGLPWNGSLVRMPLLNWIWARLTRRLERRMLAFRPDVVVATQMVPAALLSSVKVRRRVAVPSIAVPTDYGVHDFWIQPGTDVYCVAHEAIPGVPQPDLASVSVTGVPLMPAFARPTTCAQARADLELDQDRPVVLILGGGLGLGVDAVAARLRARLRDAQLVVIVGHNRPLLAALRARAATGVRELRAVGWTEDMQTFISASDVVVGKPGGLTVAEVLACGRPLLATRSLGGQEGFNARFLERQRVGRVVSEDELPACVDAWLEDRDWLAQLQVHAWSVGRRDGAARVAETALEFACAPLTDLAAGGSA